MVSFMMAKFVTNEVSIFYKFRFCYSSSNLKAIRGDFQADI
jgi:hypothetical protein